MKLLGSIESKTTEDKNGKNMPLFEATEIVLVHCNIVSNDHQKDSRVLYTFAPNKSLGQLLDISTKSFIFSKTFDLKFSYIEIWFSDQNYKHLEIEGKTNITLVIN